MGRVLPKELYDLNHFSIYGMVSPISRIHGSRSKSIENGIVPFIITSSDPLGKLFLLVPMILNSAGQRLLVPQWGSALARNHTTNCPLK